VTAAAPSGAVTWVDAPVIEMVTEAVVAGAFVLPLVVAEA
jgi:hypothetical protein